MLSETFAAPFIKACCMNPLFASSTVSMLNAEKVLKPPQKPMAKKFFQMLLLASLPANWAPINMPMMSELVVLETSVAQWN